MATVVVCAEPANLQRAGRFAANTLGDAELRSFEDLRRRTPEQPILVYLTHSGYDHLRALLRILKPARPDVVIFCATRTAPEEALRLGKLVGEVRPHHTTVEFEANAAAASVLAHSRASSRKRIPTASSTRTRVLRQHLGLTQTEMSHALGVSLRTVQNWERPGVARRARQLRDLEELWKVLKQAIKASDLKLWLRSKSDAFGGRRPLELLKEGKARDIIVEFRRLQAGEPV